MEKKVFKIGCLKDEKYLSCVLVSRILCPDTDFSDVCDDGHFITVSGYCEKDCADITVKFAGITIGVIARHTEKRYRFYTRRYHRNYFNWDAISAKVRENLSAGSFDSYSLNCEYNGLLRKHERDTDVTGYSRDVFIKGAADEEDAEIRQFWAMAYNAWDELCDNHPGLRESGLNWYCGALLVGYDSPYDLYIGTGDEEYI